MNNFREFVLSVCVTAQWLKFSLNKFRERFQIRKIREIKDPRNISAIRYCHCLLVRRWVSFPPIFPLPLFTNNNWATSLATFTHRLVVNVLLQLRNFVLSESRDSCLFGVELSPIRVKTQEVGEREREREMAHVPRSQVHYWSSHLPRRLVAWSPLLAAARQPASKAAGYVSNIATYCICL